MPPALSFKVERFESIPSSARHSLLRLRGRWLAAEPATLDAPALVVAVQGDVRRHAPLEPRDAKILAGPEPELWRCAFAVPADLLGAPGARFALAGLEADVELPAPIELQPGDPAGEEPALRERREVPDRRRPLDRRTEPSASPAGRDRRRDSRRRTADRRRRRSRAELDAFARKLMDLETHVATVEGARSELLVAHERLQSDLEEAHAAREVADLAAVRQAQAELADAEQRAVELEARAADAQARVHGLENHATELAARALALETEARAAQGRADSVEAELAERLEQVSDEHHGATRAFEDERDRLERRHAQARGEAEAARDELARRAERIRALESEVAELRRRVAEASPAPDEGPGTVRSESERAQLLAALEDQAAFAEQAGASLWATEWELRNMRTSHEVLAAERDDASRRAQEAAERAARLAARLRDLGSSAPS